ncbi:MAG: hypothetical protein NZ899_00985 [Thermoguttaceae bacterium]|nr:hypothetical protein [Thermoguttaceae bacterium]MDW8077469.1 hypothetical protein [Thermoguttaceae bacterium]
MRHKTARCHACGLVLTITLAASLATTLARGEDGQEMASAKPLPMGPQFTAPTPMPFTGGEFVLPHPGTSWHAGYYHPAWGLPVAVVVPPTARFEAKYSWGVGGSQSVLIRHQFSRNYPGPGQILRQRLLAAPRWPTHTDQLGVYPIRGPW